MFDQYLYDTAASSVRQSHLIECPRISLQTPYQIILYDGVFGVFSMVSSRYQKLTTTDGSAGRCRGPYLGETCFGAEICGTTYLRSNEFHALPSTIWRVHFDLNVDLSSVEQLKSLTVVLAVRAVVVAARSNNTKTIYRHGDNCNK